MTASKVYIVLFGILSIAYHLSAAPLSAPEELFSEIDENRDTVLDIDELREWLGDMFENIAVEYAPVDKFVTQFDSDKDKKLDVTELDELSETMPFWNQSMPEEFDEDEDGKLDKEELGELVGGMLRQMMHGSTPAGMPPMPKVVQDTNRKRLSGMGINPAWYDLNKDGQMSELELVMVELVLNFLKVFDANRDNKVARKEFEEGEREQKMAKLVMEPLEAAAKIAAKEFQ